jgi:hypothetical protein
VIGFQERGQTLWAQDLYLENALLHLFEMHESPQKIGCLQMRMTAGATVSLVQQYPEGGRRMTQDLLKTSN